MNSNSARQWYLSGLFLLLMSNVISAFLAAVGVQGFAFYHVEAILLCLCGTQFCVVLLSFGARRTIDSTVFRFLLISLLYTIVSSVFLLRFGDIGPAYVALIIHTLVFYPATALLMIGCARPHDATGPAGIPNWILWGAIAILLFGWMQYLVGDPILEVANADNVSKMVAANVLGTFRPSSVFASSFQFGLFSVLAFCIAFSHAVFGRSGVLAWILSMLALSGVALSQTRNVFLCALCCATSLAFLVRWRKRGGRMRLFRFAPFAYMLGSVGMMVYAVIHFLGSDMTKTGDLADASSTWARVSSWQQAWHDIVLRGSLLDSLFGYGITQAGQASDYRNLYPARAEGLFIDNSFVNLFLLQGVVGLLIFVLLWWIIWKRLLKRTQETWDPLAVGITAFYSTFLAAGVFNILNGQWWGITLALSLFVLSRPQKTAELRLSCAA
ncbi:MAG: hypothetical protein ROO76_07945 [Terriglobia bacterium]|jgi:hypothetical protein|nr:hypothetical protein [Terriglobia bacterium]